MLTVIVSGCGFHQDRMLKFGGLKAKLMEDLFRNLPQKHGVPFYLCENGHTHQITFFESDFSASFEAQVYFSDREPFQQR